jgi:hypothetical protein
MLATWLFHSLQDQGIPESDILRNIAGKFANLLLKTGAIKHANNQNSSNFQVFSIKMIRKQLPSFGVKLYKVLNLDIFTRVSANPVNCCGLFRGTILYKSPQHFAGFAVTLVKIFKFKSLYNVILPQLLPVAD